ncbi:dephospho-CoA kinase [Synechocystis salina]|uniref:Dephospho-CoA kinase n=1 Tax=Synechocystis salina LEGE 00031 TaxID=1828736 RepID=A0ABR9VPE2_9SYNC|nr:dephospho-CoA kinase [Synechocystis salina]MBE9239908.1 dephospho-CoA kinase [Synechocystis salina LEGE 00041]MBE9253209.1 dephospho-CoA kinase [Synechocystis salina LEGE 00031]
MDTKPPQQRLIGLTGGIATGKSTVSDFLNQKYGVPILDADLYARQAVASGSKILLAIARRYGPEIVDQQGHLNRQALGEIIFNNAQEKQWLESQIHPFVKQCFQSALAQLEQEQTVVLSIPLLFEAQLTHWVTEIWVVTCGPAQQIERLIQRNGLTEAQALARIAIQMPLAEKIAQADMVLDNSGQIADLESQIVEAWRLLF